MVDAVDDRTHDVLQVLEVEQQPGRVELFSTQRDAHLVVVAVRVLALAFVIAR